MKYNNYTFAIAGEFLKSVEYNNYTVGGCENSFFFGRVHFLQLLYRQQSPFFANLANTIFLFCSFFLRASTIIVLALQCVVITLQLVVFRRFGCFRPEYNNRRNYTIQ